MKTKVALMFGGKTVEHEVSVISGIQALKSMDTDKYEVIPAYMTKENDMYIGTDIGKHIVGHIRLQCIGLCHGGINALHQRIRGALCNRRLLFLSCSVHDLSQPSGAERGHTDHTYNRSDKDDKNDVQDLILKPAELKSGADIEVLSHGISDAKSEVPWRFF